MPMLGGSYHEPNAADMHRVKNLRTLFQWRLSEATAAARLITREREQCAKIARQFSEEAASAILKRSEKDEDTVFLIEPDSQS